jgi:hypothetical protein
LRTRIARVVACVLLSLAAAPGARAAERVTLKPDDRAGWSPLQLFGVLRPGYHSERTLSIETSPPGATLDLFYVRASFQKRYEQAQAPVIVDLPTRAEAGKRDSVTIRAFLPGRKIETVHVPVRGSQDRVVIDLELLPNALTGVAHSYFAGRAGLSLLLKVPATARVQKAEQGFTVILGQTAEMPGAESVLEGLRSPLVERIEAQQLGEELLLKVRLAPGITSGSLELRSREQADPVRGLHRFTIDMIPRGESAQNVERARAALSQVGPGDVAGCAATFDRTLRQGLDAEALARALAPRGDFTDPYLRAALRRLGEVSPGGAIELDDGARYRPGVPLELAAAATQASSARGYLALLRGWVRVLEPSPHRPEALRSLVAPEMDPAAFGEALAAAQGAEQRCRGTAAAGRDTEPDSAS